MQLYDKSKHHKYEKYIKGRTEKEEKLGLKGGGAAGRKRGGERSEETERRKFQMFLTPKKTSSQGLLS